MIDMVTINRRLRSFNSRSGTSYRYRGAFLLKFFSIPMMAASVLIALGMTPALQSDSPLTYLCAGAYAMLGLAILMGKTFLPRDLSDGSDCEFHYGVLTGTALTVAVTLVGYVAVNIGGDSVTNLVLMALALAPIVIAFKMNSDYAADALDMLMLGLAGLGAGLLLAGAFEWISGQAGRYVYLTPLAVSFIGIAFSVFLRFDEVETYAETRCTREPNVRMFSRTKGLMMAVTLALSVLLVIPLTGVLNSGLFDILSSQEFTGEELEAVVLSMHLLPLAELVGIVSGYIAGLVKSRHPITEGHDYITVIKYAAVATVVAFIICASIPLYIIYGITYAVILVMIVGIAYVVLAM